MSGSYCSYMLSYILLNAEFSEFQLFMGRFHPLLVHLPIGFLFVVVALEYLSWKKGKEYLSHAITVVLGMTAVSSIIAAVLGYFLSLGGDYDADILFWHKWFGIALAAGSTIAWLFRIQSGKSASRNFRLGYLFFLIVSFLLLIGTGHQGGSLTHGEDYLTSYMPDPLRAVSGLPPKQHSEEIKITNLNEAVVYPHIIQPVLNQRCISCHGSSKKKGDLMLNTMENILKGGESGKVITPGNPSKSKLYTYLLLPEGDDKHMPPKGKVQLTREQVRIIGWWIEQGAPADKKVAGLKVPDSIKTALTKIVEGEKKPEGIFAKQVKPADPEKLGELGKKGLQTASIAADVNYIQAYLAADRDSFGLKEAEALLSISDQLAWLDLSSKKIHPDALKTLAKFPNLSKLHLENTDIRDDMLKSISTLKHLEYLNLYGTGITDAGIEHLMPLKQLRYIYLWQTRVTPVKIAKLKAKNRALVVNTGGLQ